MDCCLLNEFDLRTVGLSLVVARRLLRSLDFERAVDEHSAALISEPTVQVQRSAVSDVPSQTAVSSPPDPSPFMTHSSPRHLEASGGIWSPKSLSDILAECAQDAKTQFTGAQIEARGGTAVQQPKTTSNSVVQQGGQSSDSNRTQDAMQSENAGTERVDSDALSVLRRKVVQQGMSFANAQASDEAQLRKFLYGTEKALAEQRLAEIEVGLAKREVDAKVVAAVEAGSTRAEAGFQTEAATTEPAVETESQQEYADDFSESESIPENDSTKTAVMHPEPEDEETGNYSDDFSVSGSHPNTPNIKKSNEDSISIDVHDSIEIEVDADEAEEGLESLGIAEEISG